jgi:hypothetical protein
MGMAIEDTKAILNGGTRDQMAEFSAFWGNGTPIWATVPRHDDLRTLELEGEPIVVLEDDHPIRQALRPAVEALHVH